MIRENKKKQSFVKKQKHLARSVKILQAKQSEKLILVAKLFILVYIVLLRSCKMVSKVCQCTRRLLHEHTHRCRLTDRSCAILKALGGVTVHKCLLSEGYSSLSTTALSSNIMRKQRHKCGLDVFIDLFFSH